jgi:hypothetical protein
MLRTRPGLVLLTALALLGGLFLVVQRKPSPVPAFAVVNPATAGQLPNSPSPAPGSPTPAGKVGVAPRPVTVRYTFDGGIHRPITDVAGHHELWPLGENGGALRLVRQGAGLALAYPSRCTLPKERNCPRAILEGARDDSLNPGTRPLAYGASVRMTHGDLSDGANVVQKGYSVGGKSQFKLQVDHQLGHPSCVLAGTDHSIYRAEPMIDVADGKWHSLTCTRTPNRLALSVDGVVRAAVDLPPALSIANAEPLRIGGKGPGKGNDQFAGEIDNVFLTIG